MELIEALRALQYNAKVFAPEAWDAVLMELDRLRAIETAGVNVATPEVADDVCPMCTAPVKIWRDHQDGRGDSYEYVSPRRTAENPK